MACKCSDFELPKKIILNENIESNSTSLLVPVHNIVPT